MRNKILLTAVFFLETLLIQSQISKDTISYSLNTRLAPGFGEYAPFLSTANQYDRHSISPNSISIWGDIHKKLNTDATFDYGFGTELNTTFSKTESRFFPGELYLEGKAYFMKATFGMKRRIYSNEDPELSSGGMLWSRNSRPMPGISIESTDYLNVPFTHGYIEVKGGLTHGWFSDSTLTTNTLMHHKYAYIRVGGSFPVNISYGLQHVCQWAGTSPRFGYAPANWSNYKRIFLAKSGDSSSPGTEQYNALGNHIISKNLGLDVNLKSVSVSLYWQNLYEDGPLRFMWKNYNVEDGLFGASFKFNTFKPLNRLVLEYLSTTDQSGPWHDLDGVIYGGTDNYYNNGVYPNGWTFYGMTLGNPWLTSPKYNENGAVYVENNKVRLYYLAGMGSLKDVSYKATVAYSKNWGSTYYTYPECKRQLSYQLQTSTPFRPIKNANVTLGVSGDRGGMYGDNFAFLLGFSLTGNFIY